MLYPALVAATEEVPYNTSLSILNKKTGHCVAHPGHSSAPRYTASSRRGAARCSRPSSAPDPRDPGRIGDPATRACSGRCCVCACFSRSQNVRQDWMQNVPARATPRTPRIEARVPRTPLTPLPRAPDLAAASAFSRSSRSRSARSSRSRFSRSSRSRSLCSASCRSSSSRRSRSIRSSSSRSSCSSSYRKADEKYIHGRSGRDRPLQRLAIVHPGRAW